MMPERAPRSLRWRLVAWLLSLIVLAWGVTLVVSYLDTRREVDRLLDAHLALSASLLVAQAGHEMDEIEIEDLPKLEEYGRQVVFQIWDRGEELVLRSARSPRQRLSSQASGFSDAELEGKRWRVFSSWDADHTVLVQVGEEAASRDTIATSIGRNLLWPLLVALPAIAALVWMVIGQGLRSLVNLGKQVALREPSNLAALEAENVPAEVAPLVTSLNRLFERVGTSMENERRFTADAAHELRTPFAALRAQAEVARGAGTDVERLHALDQIIAACDRAARLMQQMLTLARMEPEHFSLRHDQVDLSALARRVMADLAPAAMAQGAEMELECEGAVIVSGDADLLELLVRNLADNAVRHGGGQVHVRVMGGAGDAVTLEVRDQGPGLGEADRQRLGERFFRPLKSATGSGLGLSIVLRIASLHGAVLKFAQAQAGRGLSVSVRFPAVSG
jgi:two-component system sensor histidine kinase QseC